MVHFKPYPTPAINVFDDYPEDTPVTVYNLTLESDGAPSREKTYIRLPPPFQPYLLRISIDPGTAASKGGVLFTNFPLNGTPFARDSYHQVELPQDFSRPFEIDIPISVAGAFSYYIEHASGDPPVTSRIRCSPGYFSVSPVLSIPRRSPILSPDFEPLPPGEGGVIQSSTVPLPLDGLVIQTIIAKWMGTLKEWTPHLERMSRRGYNMIHFTPLQQRGESNSPYSIFEQLEFSDDLFEQSGLSKDAKDEKMKEALAGIKKNYGMLGMIDVVLNHTANNSPWLEDHPEAGYNAINSPHLLAAVELDTALMSLSASLEFRGLPTLIESMEDIDRIMNVVDHELLPNLKLYEYYVIHVSVETAKFREAWTTNKKPANASAAATGADIASLPIKDLAAAFVRVCLPDKWDHLGPRHAAQVDLVSSIAFVQQLGPKDVEEAVAKFSRILDEVNLPRYQQWDEDRKAIMDNTKNRLRYTRLDKDGPKLGQISFWSPFAEPLFTRIVPSERTKGHDPLTLILANNGWIWDADPLVDFASSSSRTYLRRDLIVWGDCVKLRYGAGEADNPWLWSHMTAYVETLAEMFDGFRLDNSHSTPIHVGEVLLDRARVVRPNLYVCAELFTGSEVLDLHFVCRLGLNSLIRETMNADDPKAESGLLYAYGLGKPIGAMDTDCLTTTGIVGIKGGTYTSKVIPLSGSVPQAFLMDCTHDNESPLSKRTAEDALATGALVTFARAAVGSTRGFDDLYPKLLDVVHETRKYELYESGTENGIGDIKRLLNHLHTEMVLNGGDEGHFSQEGDYIMAHRVNPVTHQGYLLIARTAFHPGPKSAGDMAPVRLDHTRVKFVAGAIVNVKSTALRDTETTLRGLDAELIPIPPFDGINKKDQNTGADYAEIVVPVEFPPGSVLVFATWVDSLDASLDDFCGSGATEAFAGLDMVDLNPVLFRADGEERDALGGDGVYTVPGIGPLLYCGFQGWMPHVQHIMEHNDLGHPLCAHLREGTWALDYVHGRLAKQVERLPHLAEPAAWIKERFEKIKADVPAFLRPKYFCMVINVAYKASHDHAIELMSPLIRSGNNFVVALALTSVQMYGEVASASLDPFKVVPSLAAGLPHFTTGWARTWGRDVFISLRGLFLVTGQFEAAKEHILAFSSVLKHGLIPNLLDSGKTPRYNSRDSPWFMLQNIQDYATMAPEGLKILEETCRRRFPLSDEWVPFDDPRAYATTSSVSDIIQEILQRHASGIHFREYNAGPNLDMQMTDAGFNIDIDVDWTTGLIFGGNQWNCGTWMDKMGESEKANNKGLPGTPRDGAPVEITGLLKSTLRWLAEISASGDFPHKGVEATVDGKKKRVTYQEWNDLIQKSFEHHYYVPTDSAQDKDYVINPALVARRGIYKDVHGTGAGRERADYQLRANQAVAMAVAPELFDPNHALGALAIYEANLVGPLGVKTLDPADPDYRGNYDNSNDGYDRSVAKGWNYHQGPEWVWPMGYFLRAHLVFDTQVGIGKDDPTHTYHHIFRVLSRHRDHMATDPWVGLPELTNEHGEYCHDSCRTQAWSSSTILDVIDDISQRFYQKPNRF